MNLLSGEMGSPATAAISASHGWGQAMIVVFARVIRRNSNAIPVTRGTDLLGMAARNHRGAVSRLVSRDRRLRPADPGWRQQRSDVGALYGTSPPRGEIVTRP